MTLFNLTFYLKFNFVIIEPKMCTFKKLKEIGKYRENLQKKFANLDCCSVLHDSYEVN